MEGSSSHSRFEKMALEVNFVVTRATQGRAGFKLQVLALGGAEVGGDKSWQEQQVHKITLSLKAIPEEDRKRIKTGGGPTDMRGLHPAPVPID